MQYSYFCLNLMTLIIDDISSGMSLHIRLEVLIRSELLPFFMLSSSIVILYTEVSRLQILNVSTILCGTCIDGFAR